MWAHGFSETVNPEATFFFFSNVQINLEICRIARRWMCAYMSVLPGSYNGCRCAAVMRVAKGAQLLFPLISLPHHRSSLLNIHHSITSFLTPAPISLLITVCGVGLLGSKSRKRVEPHKEAFIVHLAHLNASISYCPRPRGMSMMQMCTCVCARACSGGTPRIKSCS